MESDSVSLEYSALGFNANTNARELMETYSTDFGKRGSCIAYSDATGMTCKWSDDPGDIYLLRLKEAEDNIAVFSGQRDDMTDLTLRFMATEPKVLDVLGFEKVDLSDPEKAQKQICPDPIFPLPVRDPVNRVWCTKVRLTASTESNVPCVIFNDNARTECGFQKIEGVDLYFRRDKFGELTTCSVVGQGGKGIPVVTCSPSVRSYLRPIATTAEICDPDFIPVLKSDGDIVCRKKGCVDLEKCK
jgi:hypothetical protein